MTTVTQNFNQPIIYCLSNEDDIWSTATRKWETKSNEKLADITQQMGYIGKQQIEEVWKHAGYFTVGNSKKIWERVPDKEKPQNKTAHIYVSNYGYIAAFTKEEGEKIFTGENGTSINYLPKELLKKRNIVPENRVDSGCEICLNVLAETNNSEWDIHRLVAKNFLEEPEESERADDADLRGVIEVHVMRVHDLDRRPRRALHVEIVERIHHPVRPPADAEERVVGNHGDRALPEREAHLRRGVEPREDRGHPLEQRGVEREDTAAHEHAGNEHAPVAQRAVGQEHRRDGQACAARIRHGEARGEREQRQRQHEPLAARLHAEEYAEHEAHHDIEIASEDIRVLPGGKDALAQLGERLAVHPFHRARINAEGELVEAVEHAKQRGGRQRGDEQLELPARAEVLPDEEIHEQIDADEVVVVVKAERRVR